MILDAAGRHDLRQRGVRGLVVLIHGGNSVSAQPTSTLQLSVLRMVPIARAVRQSLSGHQIAVCRPRLDLRGWNGSLASPVADLTGWLDEISAQLGDVPVALIGHSLGGRAVLRAAGHPQVRAVCGLAPWLPGGEPVAQLAGRRVLLAHGDNDRITSRADTWAYARRVSAVTAIEVRGGEHTLLWRAPVWHQIAVEFARACFGLSAGQGPIADLVTRSGTDAAPIPV